MATERSLFLINNARPDLAVSPRFEVREGAVRLTASGITGGSYVKLRKQISPASGSFAAVWADVIRQGQAVRLSQNNMEHLELVSGIYEVEFVGAEGDQGGNVVIYLEEDQKNLDSKLQYTFPAYNPTFNGSVTGTGLSPALIGSRDRTGRWMYDSADKQMVWVETVVDTSTGAVTYTFLSAPGGTPVVPGNTALLLEQPDDLFTETKLFVEPIANGQSIDLANFSSSYAIREITLIIDNGEFDITTDNGFGAGNKTIIGYTNESFTWNSGGDMSWIEKIGTIASRNTGVDAARLIILGAKRLPSTAPGGGGAGI